MAVESITLNLIPTGEIPTIHVAQFDNERLFNIILKEGEDDFTPTGYGIEIQVRKVDNNIVTAQPVDVVGNVITISTTEQMTACSGTNICELELTKDDISVATLRFYLVVQRDVLAGGLTSQSEIYNLEGQIAAIVPEVIGDEYYTAAQVDALIEDIPTFDPSNYYDKTQLYTKTETNGFLSQKANTSALSTVAFTGDYDDLIDKPTIPDVSDYYTKAETYSQEEVNTLLGAKADTSSLSTVATSGDYDDLTNKPTIPAAQVNSDWNSTSGVSEILNKPTVYQNAAVLPISANDSTDTKSYIDMGLSGKTQVKVAKETLTTNSSGFAQINVAPKKIIVLSAWSSIGDVLIIPFSASNAGLDGIGLWWFRVHNDSMQIRANFNFELYYSYIETN